MKRATNHKHGEGRRGTSEGRDRCAPKNRVRDCAGHELGIYVHVPFCLRRCRYCDFYSRPYEPREAERYVTCLLREAAHWGNLAKASGRKATSLYIGGGTPTSLAAPLLHRLVAGVRGSFRWAPKPEVTGEANPCTLSSNLARMLHDLGINRLSIGAQAGDDRTLCWLGRLHTAQQVRQAVRVARSAGFANLNLDLLAGIPGRQIREWEATLRWVVGLGPEHISCYPLTVEPDTPLGREVAAGQELGIDADAQADEMALAARVLTDAGYSHYEIANFALPGRESQHNLLYWRGDDYLGLGPAAASSLAGARWSNPPSLGAYCAALEGGVLPWRGLEGMGCSSRAGEALMLGLRLLKGMSRTDFARLWQQAHQTEATLALADLIDGGLLLYNDHRVGITEYGVLLGNLIWERVVAAAR